MSSPGSDDLLAHAAFLRALARGLLHDAHLADDAVQETYLAALERPPAGRVRWRAWLATVVRNVSIKLARGEARRGRRERAAARTEGQPPADDVAAQLEAQRRVVDAVASLEEPYRETVVLRYFQRLSVREIARLHGIPAATVHTRLRRALERLRARLDAEPGGRRAWTLALLPLAARWPTPALTNGVVAMSLKKKTALVALLLVVLGLSSYMILRPHPTSPARAEARSPVVAGEPSVPGNGEESARPVGIEEPALRGRVVDPEGSAVGGARVSVVAESSATGVRPEEAAASALSTDDGRFVLRLPRDRGAFVLCAEKAGRAPALLRPVTPGDDVLVVLEAPTLLHGRVTDLSGKGVEAARLRWVGFFGGVHLEREATSGQDGDYRLEVVPVLGGFAVSVGSGGAVVDVDAPGYAPQSVSLDYWNRLSREEMVMDFVLVRGRTVRGRVLDDAERPVAGARVVLWHRRVPLSYQGPRGSLPVPRSVQPLAEARSARDGSFSFACVPADGLHKDRGVAYLGAEAEGYVRGAVAVPIGSDRATVEIDIPLARPGDVDGRVLDLRGRPIEGAKVGLVVARDMTLWPDAYGAAGSFEVRSGPDGAYRLAGMPAGAAPCKLRASAEEQQAQVEVVVRASDVVRAPDLILPDPKVHLVQARVTDDSGQPVRDAWVDTLPRSGTVRSGADGSVRFTPRLKEGATVVLVAGADGFAPTVSAPFVLSPEPIEVAVRLRRGLRLSGRVEWADGVPAASAFVSVSDGTAPLEDTIPAARMEAEARGQRIIFYGVTRAGPDGSFTALNLPPGPYHVTATLVRPPSEPAETTASNVDTARDLVLRLPVDHLPPPSAVIEGSVSDDAGPLVVFHAWANRRSVRFPLRVVGVGRFRGEPLDAGTWKLYVTAPDHLPLEREIEVADGARVRADLVLRRGAIVRGKVDGVELDGARVGFWSDEGKAVPAVPLAEGGTYSMAGLAPGRYQPFVERPPNLVYAAPDRALLVVADGAEQVTFDFAVVPAGPLSWTAKGDRLSIRDAEERPVLVRTGLGARSGVAYLPPGRYVVRLEAPGRVPVERAVDVSVEKATRADFGD